MWNKLCKSHFICVKLCNKSTNYLSLVYCHSDYALSKVGHVKVSADLKEHII